MRYIYKVVTQVKPVLRRLYSFLEAPPTPNLRGDRDIEYSWAAAHTPDGPGEALDFGCGQGWLGLLGSRKGFTVTAVDLQPITWPYTHEKLTARQGDIRALELQSERFDLIFNCSAIEHVGLAGRYGVVGAADDGDVDVMGLLWTALKPGGTSILTVPVGADATVGSLHRVYGPKRLPRLLNRWDILKREYWVKDVSNRWVIANEIAALSQAPSEHYYGLGLFVLRRPA
jgi:SAM-dependent methyltransferase